VARVRASKGRRAAINSPGGPPWRAGHAQWCAARTRWRRRRSPGRRRRGGGDDRWGPRVSDCARGRAERLAGPREAGLRARAAAYCAGLGCAGLLLLEGGIDRVDGLGIWVLKRIQIKNNSNFEFEF
jgi:hypothetical protein